RAAATSSNTSRHERWKNSCRREGSPHRQERACATAKVTPPLLASSATSSGFSRTQRMRSVSRFASSSSWRDGGGPDEPAHSALVGHLARWPGGGAPGLVGGHGPDRFPTEHVVD